MAKKEVNVELNMTPFIGLFALLVVMLLLTAVWNVVLVHSTDTSSTTASNSPSDENPEKKVKLFVTILPKKIEMAEDSDSQIIPHVRGYVDKMNLVAMLAQWKTKYPDRSDVILNTENTVTYKMLIDVFDTLVGHGWHDVGVNTQ